MTEESTHIGPNDADPARMGGQIGTGLVPDEVVEGEAEEAAVRSRSGDASSAQTNAADGQSDEGLVEPGGVDGER